MKVAAEQIDIDRIVREVLETLAVAPSSAAPRPTPTAVEATDSTAPRPGPGELVLAERVVTMAVVEGRLDGVRTVVVPRGAVVTPAVYDELQDRDLELVFRTSQEADAVTAANEKGLFLARVGTNFEPRPLVQALEAVDFATEIYENDCLIAATDRATEAVRGGRLAVILTGYPAAGICLANRHEGVRAILAFDVEQMEKDARRVGANVAVLDPSGDSVHRIRRKVLRFAQGGLRPCPEPLRGRLA